MAKKQAMNVFEAHLEKILLGVSTAVLIWVVISQVFKPPGVMVGDGVKNASEATREMAAKAEEIAGEMNRPGPAKNLPTLEIPPDIIVSHPLKNLLNDKLYLSPPVPGQEAVKPRGPYLVPEVLPTLELAKLELTHAEAYVPAPKEDGLTTSRGGMVADDVDFVTVEATLPLEELRRLFDNHFGRGNKDPLENWAPIVAVVELQHSQLMPDGTWGEYQTLRRLPVEDMADKALSPAAIDQLSQALYEVRRDEWKDPVTQLLLLKPQPYDLVKGEWTSPSEQIETKKETKKGSANKKAKPDVKPGGKKVAPVAPADGGMPGMPGMGMPGMGMPGMGMPGMGMGEPGMAPTRTTVATTKYDVEKDYINAKKLTLWAHDDLVEPGEIYRYRLRVGFFNPVAGHDNWVTPDQTQKTTQRVLWTAWIEPQDVVRVPQRILFFPKQSGGGTASVEVYRWQQGRWFTRNFPVTPGSMIGDLRPTRSDASDAKKPAPRKTTRDSDEDIDYRTGAMVVDIIPEARYYQLQGATLMDMVTSELMYRDRDGQIKRVPADKRAWPDEMRTLYSEITKEIRAEEKPQNKPGTPGMPGGQGPGGMPGMPGMPGM